MGLNSINGQDLVRMIQAGTALLEQNKSRVDALNVFPVPDGDTGTNMYLTLMSASREAEKRQEDNIGNVGKAISMGSLMGARGNSGVILSQVFRGMAKELDSRGTIDAREFAACLQAGSDTAYKAVMKPVEGTILTIVREIARAAAVSAKQSDDIIIMMQESLEAGNRMLARTPQMLPILKEAGVVDSGGQGFLIMYEGMLSALAGETTPTVRFDSAPVAVQESVSAAQGTEYGYCTEVLIRGEHLDVDGIRNKLDPMGNSILVVGEHDLVKVHIHSLHPGKILEECLRWGTLHDIKIDNLEEEAEAQAKLQNGTADEAVELAVSDSIHEPQREADDSLASVGAQEVVTDPKAVEPVEQPLMEEIIEIPIDMTMELEPEMLAEAPYEVPSESIMNESVSLSDYKSSKKIGLVAVSQGDGWSKILYSLGVDKVVEGGQTMNPSTEDLLTAVDSVDAQTVILMPNNKNIIMAAQQAKDISTKTVEVLPTVSVTQAVAALVVFDPDSAVTDLVDAMNEEAERIAFGEVTTAIRDSAINGLHIKEGDIIGLIDDEVRITGSSIDEVVMKVLQEIGGNGDLITLYYGNGIKEYEAEGLKTKVQAAHSMQDVELHYGGQPFYHYLISVE